MKVHPIHLEEARKMAQNLVHYLMNPELFEADLSESP